MRQWITDQLRSLSFWLGDIADRIEPERPPSPWRKGFPLLDRFPATMTTTDEPQPIVWGSKYIDPAEFDPTVTSAKPE